MYGVIALLLATGGVLAYSHYEATGPLQSQPVDAGRGQSLITKYRIFVSAAYDYSVAHPGFSGTFGWASIATAVPPSIAAINMPSNWTVVANGTGYVVCTPIPDGNALGELGRHFAGGEKGLVSAPGNKLVVGKPADSAALALEAAKCP